MDVLREMTSCFSVKPLLLRPLPRETSMADAPNGPSLVQMACYGSFLAVWGGDCLVSCPERFPLTTSLHPHTTVPGPQAREQDTSGQEGEVTSPQSTASNGQGQDSNSGSLVLESTFSILRHFLSKI